MLIFGMGLYGLFISNVPHDVPSIDDRALKGSSLFGMFALKVSLLPFHSKYKRNSHIHFSNLNRYILIDAKTILLYQNYSGSVFYFLYNITKISGF